MRKYRLALLIYTGLALSVAAVFGYWWVSMSLQKQALIDDTLPVFEGLLIDRSRQFINNSEAPSQFSKQPSDAFIDWLQQAHSLFSAIDAFEQLIQHKNSALVDPVATFHSLTEYLYQGQTPLPLRNIDESYRSAFASVCYSSNNQNDCSFTSTDMVSVKQHVYHHFNLRLVDYAQAVQNTILKDSRYQGSLFTLIEQIEQSTIADTNGMIQEELMSFSQWIDRKMQNWLLNIANNPCTAIKDNLQELIEDASQQGTVVLINIENVIELFGEEQCVNPAFKRLTSEQYASFGTLFNKVEKQENQSDSLSHHIKPSVGNLSKLKSLPFVTVSIASPSNLLGGNYYWDPQTLAKIMVYYSEYEQFIAQHIVINDVSDNTLNNIAKNLLYHAVSNTFVAAQIAEKQASEPLRGLSHKLTEVPIEQHLLMQKVMFFRKSQQTLAQLPNVFNQLGFTDLASTATTTIRTYSMALLYEADEIAQRSRLYSVKEPRLMGQPSAVDALFGIRQPQMLKAFLAAQRQKISNLVFNYAEPSLAALAQLGYPPIPSTNTHDSVVIFRWKQTLIELDHYQAGALNNSLQRLEDFFNHSLLPITSSNCHQALADLYQPDGKDWFSLAQRNIIDAVSAYCDSVSGVTTSGE